MSTRLPLQAPVAEVLVLEDRAQVRRVGTVELPAGRSRLVLDEIAPVLADKTLRIELESGRGQVADARVVRAGRIREAERPAAVQAREEALRELRRQRLEVEGRLQRGREQLDRLVAVARQVVGDLEQDLAWGQLDLDAGLAELDRVHAAEDQARDAVLALHEEAEALDRRILDLGQLVAVLQGPGTRVRADLHLEVELPEAGSLGLAICYVVPGACWRPLHRATLAGEHLQLESFGCVWQNTGEDWSGARIALSTQRASLGAEPPLLGEDLLSSRPRQEQVVVEARDQAIQTAGLGGGTTESPELPGIDDGGEVRTLRVEGRPAVPSDGRPHRLPLGSFEVPAEQALVALPERASAVLRRVRADNRAPGPLLAGPVELVAEGGRVGRTTLRYVAPGERFELGFGPDPALRLHRRAERTEHEPGVLSRWATTSHRVTLALSNLAPTPRRVLVTERVPVSEVEQVRIEVDGSETSEGARPDADGMVQWTVDLAGGGTATRVLAYAVEKKKDVAGI